MDTIRLIVKSILLIVFMAAFLEIVLPRSDMKRYVNLVIGLFVIIAILNPFLSVMGKDFSLSVLENIAAPSDRDTQVLISKGQEIGAAQKAQAVAGYKEKLAKQVQALANLYPNVKVKQVEVQLGEDPAAADFGQLRKIILKRGSAAISSENDPLTGVREVQVDDIRMGREMNPQPAKANQSSGDVVGLRDVIANFYGLSIDQIAIQN